MAELSWRFPQVAFLRIELAFIIILAVLIFLISLYQFSYQWIVALATALIFLGLYLLVAHGAKAVQAVEDVYHLGRAHLEIHRTRKNKVRHEKVPLKHIRHHKLDRFFLGGYLVTKYGRKHLLYFNTRKELEKFERYIKGQVK